MTSSSSNIIMMIMSRRKKGEGQVEMNNVHKIVLGKPKGRGHLEDLSVDGRAVSQWTLKIEYQDGFVRLR
jgi:hypothetical protein